MGIITALPHIISNSFVIQAEKTVLVDASMPNQEGRILKALAQQNIAPESIDYILLTHGHPDHFGSADALRQHLDVPLVVHAGDVASLEATIVTKPMPLSWEGRLLLVTIPDEKPSLNPDMILSTPEDYDALGIGGTMLHTQGHSEGSIALIFDDEAIIGDTLRGGYLNVLMPHQPRLPFFLDDKEALPILFESIKKLLNTSAKIFHVGHGGELHRDRVARWFETISR